MQRCSINPFDKQEVSMEEDSRFDIQLTTPKDILLYPSMENMQVSQWSYEKKKQAIQGPHIKHGSHTRTIYEKPATHKMTIKCIQCVVTLHEWNLCMN